MEKKQVTRKDLVEIVDESAKKASWRAAIYVAPEGELRFHAYAVHAKTGHLEKEGEYKEEISARYAAQDLAHTYVANHMKPRYLKR